MNRADTKLLLLSITMLFAFNIFSPSHADAAVTNLGRTYFGDNAATTGTLRFKSLTASPHTWSAQVTSGAANSANSMITWLVAKTASTRDEQMVGMLRINGTLDIQTCTTNSGTCTARWNNPGTQAGTPLCTTTATAGSCVQPFDIGYEPLDGRAMVAYGDTTAGFFYYALWDGSSWSPNSTPGSPGSSNQVALSGGTLIPRWVRVIPAGDNLADSRSNAAMVLVGSSVNISDTTYTLDAYYWDGSSFSAATTLSTTLGNCTKGRCFDGNWQGTHTFIVNYTNNGVSEVRYQKYVVGTGWGGDTQAYTTASTPIFLTSNADPTSSRIIVTTVASGNDTRSAVWRGDDATDGWTVCSGTCPDTAIETVGGNQAQASFGRFSGGGLHVYNDAGTTADSKYWQYTAPSTWGTVTATGITTTDDSLNTKAIGAPNSNYILVLNEDVDCRLRVRMWTGSGMDTTTTEMNNGTTATISNYGVTCPLSTTPGVAPIGIPYAYDYAWKMYSPWSLNWRWYSGADTTDTPTTALAAENATTTAADGYNGQFRLRFNVTELSAGVNQTVARKKLQYSTSTNLDSQDTYWADVDNAGGSGEWRYFDCNGGNSVCDDGTVVSANVLTGSTVAGWWNTSKDAAAGANMNHASSTVRELEFPIEANNAATGTPYYFRMYDVDQLTPVFRQQTANPATPCAGSSVCEYPELITGTSTYTLNAYRFYDNNDGTQVGNTTLAAQSATTTLTATGQQFRLRLLNHLGVAGLGVNKGDFKLQFASKGAGTWCGAPAGSWTDVGSGTAIAFYDNTTPADGDALTASTTDPNVGNSVVPQTYEEANGFTNPNAIPSGQDGEWDFSLYDNGAPGSTTYCFRFTSGEPKSTVTYSQYPALITAAATPTLVQYHYRWFYDNATESSAYPTNNTDTTLSGAYAAGNPRRLRILLENTGTGDATGYTYRLEVASTSCTAWYAVPNTAVTEPWTMTASGYVGNATPTTASGWLADPPGKTFTPGYVMTTSNTTPALTVSTTQFTEVSYTIVSTTHVIPSITYCFRLTNAGSTTHFTYTVQPQAGVSPATARPSGASPGNAGSVGNGAAVGGGGAKAPPPSGSGSGSGPAQGGGGAGGGGGDSG